MTPCVFFIGYAGDQQCRRENCGLSWDEHFKLPTETKPTPAITTAPAPAPAQQHTQPAQPDFSNSPFLVKAQ